jgi:4-methylaminobutanoate oxidase (formaldehyde-forming)
VYDCIDRVAADGSHELVHCGLKALNSLRLEKGYRDYGHDMDNLDSLLEVGLGFTADFDKPGGFVGDDCVLKQREQMRAKGGLPRRLVSIKLPSDSNVDAFLYHGEVVWRDGEIVGDVRGGAFGHTLGASVGLAMIEPSQKGKKTGHDAYCNLC